MSVYSSVIVGTDGSRTAERAVVRAATIAHGLGCQLVVATAYTRVRREDLGPRSVQARLPEGVDAFGYIGAQETARDGASHASRLHPDLDVDVATPQGEPADALLDFAQERGDALLVVGSQGLGASGLALLGNVPNRITHHAVGDVLVVRTAEDRTDDTPERVLVGTDGSKTATRALDQAAAVARALGARLTILAVGRAGWATDVLAEAEERVRPLGIEVVTDHADGSPAAVLVEKAADHDMLILGNRGMTGARRFLLGSVPNKVSHHMGTDLLIVKTT